MKIDKKLMNSRLINMGFREGLAGTPMIRKAVELWEPGTALTKSLYPALAKAFGTTMASVERAMRTAIKDVYSKGGNVYLAECFGYREDPPMVGDFVGRMAWMCSEEVGVG